MRANSETGGEIPSFTSVTRGWLNHLGEWIVPRAKGGEGRKQYNWGVKTIETWWWKENNRNVVLVEGKQ